VRKLLRAGLTAAGAELAGLMLMATAAWLLLRAAERPPIAALSVAIVAVRTLALVRGTLRYAERLAGHEVVLRHLAELRERVFAALLPHRRPEYTSGDLLARVVSDVDSVQDALLRCLLPAVVAALVSVAAVAFAFVLSPAAGLVLLAGLLLAGVVIPLLAYQSAAHSSRQSAETRAVLSQRIVDLSGGARELLVYGAAHRATRSAGVIVETLARQERRMVRAGSLLVGAGVVVQGATCVGVCVLAKLSAPMTGALTLGALAALEVVLPLTGAAQRWVDVRASIHRVRALLAEKAPGPGTYAVPSGPVTMRLEGLGVHYPGRTEPALTGIDLDLLPGKRVAVLGPSGSGKSTLLHAMLGLVEPSAGRITLNGRALSAYDPGQLPRIISGALADDHVFHTTVRENLLSDAPEERLREACAVTQFDCPFDRMADTLSGGQRQRLVLARALLSAAPVLVLDEPVEGLDRAQADAVLSAVLQATDGRAVVVATHHLPPGQHFDEIIVLAGAATVRC
jgi:ATP-binding cassette subfamily C protein CydC